MTDISQQVETIFKTYSSEQRRATPRYPFAWVLANQLVQKYYAQSGLDALSMVVGGIPSYALKLSGERGCLLQKRGQQTLGSIQFASGSVDNWRKTNDTRYEFAQDIIERNVPVEYAQARAVSHLEIEDGLAELLAGDHQLCTHTFLAESYPALFDLVTNLIVTHPGLTAEREVWVDILPNYSEVSQQPSHPLRVLGLADIGPTYDYFGLKNNETGQTIYIDINIGSVVHAVGENSWEIAPATQWRNLPAADISNYFLSLVG